MFLGLIFIVSSLVLCSRRYRTESGWCNEAELKIVTSFAICCGQLEISVVSLTRRSVRRIYFVARIN